MPIRGAQRVLFNISGGEDMTLYEVNEVAEFIGTAIDATADITFGAVIDPRLEDTLRVTLIAAGMQNLHSERIPVMQVEQAGLTSSVSLPAKQHETLDSPSRNADNFEQPLAKAPSTSAQNMPAEKTEASFLPPARQSTTRARPHRSLDDLRGLRSMGRSHEVSQVAQNGPEEEKIFDDEEIDVPPFLKKYT